MKNYLKAKQSNYVEVSILRYLLLLLVVILSVSVVCAELPTSTELDDLVLDSGIQFIRSDSSYVTQTPVKPHFLSVDSVNFIACTDESDIPKGYIVCLDNNNFVELEMYPWSGKDECYVGGAALSQLKCQNALVEVEYKVDGENVKMSKEFMIDTFSTVAEKLMSTQYTDGGWKEPLDTAFAVLALSQFKEIFGYEIDQALSWLKLDRNNNQKCWPTSPCNLKLTTKILAILQKAGINDSYRLTTDGRNYLEARQNYYKQGDSWSIKIDDVTVDTTLSLVSHGTELLDQNFTIPEKGSRWYSFKAKKGDIIRVISYDTIRTTIYDNDSNVVYQYTGSNISYTIPGACWSSNQRGEPCNTGVTAYASAANISQYRLDEAKSYMKSELRKGVVSRYYGDDDDVAESALYVKAFYDKELLDDDNVAEETQEDSYLYQVLQWVLFKQNNEGYWGEYFDENDYSDLDTEEFNLAYKSALTDELQTTAFSILALLDSGFNRTSEPIMDAQNWVTNIEDDINNTSGAALGAAMYIVKDNAYPLVYTRPSVIVMDESVKEIEIVNPTPYNLREIEFVLSNAIKDYVSIEDRKAVGAYKYRKTKLTLKKPVQTTTTGFISIANAEQEIGRIPVVILNAATLNVTLTDEASVFGRTGTISLLAVKSKHSFSCLIDWDSDELSDSKFTLSKESTNVPLTFNDAVTKEDLYKGTLTCTVGTQTFNFPVSTLIKRFSSIPLLVYPKTLTINNSASQQYASIKNNLDVDLSVAAKLSRYEEEISVPQDIFLEAGTTKNISIISHFNPELNYTGTALIEFSALGRSESISLIVDSRVLPVDNMKIVLTLLIMVFIVAVLATIGYLMYKYRDDLLVFLNKIPFFQSKAEIRTKKASLQDLRSTERNKAIMNMYEILKFQQSSDEEIKNRLMEIFSKEELKQALEEGGVLLEGLEDSEPDRI